MTMSCCCYYCYYYLCVPIVRIDMWVWAHLTCSYAYDNKHHCICFTWYVVWCGETPAIGIRFRWLYHRRHTISNDFTRSMYDHPSRLHSVIGWIWIPAHISLYCFINIHTYWWSNAFILILSVRFSTFELIIKSIDCSYQLRFDFSLCLVVSPSRSLFFSFSASLPVLLPPRISTMFILYIRWAAIVIIMQDLT